MGSFKFTIQIIDQFTEQLSDEKQSLPSVKVVYTDQELSELGPAEKRIIGEAFEKFQEARKECSLVTAVTTKFVKDCLSVRVEAYDKQ
jgi:hypothetical protein